MKFWLVRLNKSKATSYMKYGGGGEYCNINKLYYMWNLTHYSKQQVTYAEYGLLYRKWAALGVEYGKLYLKQEQHHCTWRYL